MRSRSVADIPPLIASLNTIRRIIVLVATDLVESIVASIDVAR